MFGLGSTPAQTRSDDDPSEYTLRTLATDTPSESQTSAVRTVPTPPTPVAPLGASVAVSRRSAAPNGLPVAGAQELVSEDLPMPRVPTLDPVKSNAFFRDGQATQRMPGVAPVSSVRVAQAAPRVAPSVPRGPAAVPVRPLIPGAVPPDGVQTTPVATATLADFLQTQKQSPTHTPAEDIHFDAEGSVSATPWARYAGVLIVLALVSGLAYGGYSWWAGKIPAVATVDVAATPKAPNLETAKPGEIFLADKPNYLNVTRQGLTTEALVAYLNQIADKVPNNGTAYEFLLRNEKFQSVPFDEFSKLIIPDTAVPSIFEGADMTLYITKSLNNRSLSLLITPKGDSTRTMSTLSATDSALPTQMKSLYVLGRKQPTIPEQSNFGNSEHRGVPIRYTNFTAGDTTLSLDYSLVDGKLLLSTSKDAHRAVLDKIKP